MAGRASRSDALPASRLWGAPSLRRLLALNSSSVLAPRFVLFTALENCLLDPRTDSCSAAEEVLAELDRRRIPWVIFSGRTRAQLDPLRRKMGHRHPFVAENGGGLFLPQDYFNIAVEGSRRAGGFQLIPMGTPYAETCAALEEIAGESDIEIASLARMKLQETAQNLGVSMDEAHRARQREFEELFFIAGATEKEDGGLRGTGAAAGIYGACWRAAVAIFRRSRCGPGGATACEALPRRGTARAVSSCRDWIFGIRSSNARSSEQAVSARNSRQETSRRRDSEKRADRARRASGRCELGEARTESTGTLNVNVRCRRMEKPEHSVKENAQRVARNPASAANLPA